MTEVIIAGPSQMTAGGYAVYSATGKSSANATAFTSFTWTVTAGRINSGVWTAPTTVGTYRITAESDNGVTQSLTVTVIPGPALKAAVSPDIASTTTGLTTQFTAIVTDAYGNTIPKPSIQWSAAGGMINSTGLFTAGSTAGPGTVTATVPSTYGSIKGTATVSIASPPIPAQGSNVSSTKPDGSIPSPTNSVGAHAKVAERLKGILAIKPTTSADVRMNVQAVVASMISETIASGDAKSQAEALPVIEQVLKEKGAPLTASELDVLAEVQARQGKHSEAKATLRSRLHQNPNTRAAYEAAIKLEAESGDTHDLDTYVAGKKVEFDVRPKVKDGRTLVPIRALVEALGATVKWDPATRTVTILKDGTSIELTIGSKTAHVNGQPIPLDIPAEIDEGRTLIPARFVSEGLRLFVTWLSDLQTILITEAPIE